MSSMVRRYVGLLRTSSAKPKRGVRMPLRRPDRMSWKTNGRYITGTPWMYRMAGRATITFLLMYLICLAMKW